MFFWAVFWEGLAVFGGFGGVLAVLSCVGPCWAVWGCFGGCFLGGVWRECWGCFGVLGLNLMHLLNFGLCRRLQRRALCYKSAIFVRRAPAWPQLCRASGAFGECGARPCRGNPGVRAVGFQLKSHGRKPWNPTAVSTQIPWHETPESDGRKP